MGDIFKQSVKGSIYIYLGVALGFIINGLLYPILLTTEQIGLITVLVAYSTILANIGGMGMKEVVIRLFPYFRDEKNRHHGFLLTTLLITAAGFTLIVILYIFFKDLLVSKVERGGGLFGHFSGMILFLALFSMLFALLDNYFKVLYNAVKGTFYQEVVKRFFILMAILAFSYGILDFEGFVYAYVGVAALPFLALAVSLKASRKLYLKSDFGYMSKKMWKEIADVGLFGIISGTSGILILQLDRIMVHGITGELGETGVYAISFFFGSLVQKPAKALLKISSVFISEAWKGNRMAEISSLYTKSVINQLLVGMILFIGLVVNLDNIFEFLSEDYQEGRNVIILIALAYLIDMGAGINGVIISTSRLYRWKTFLILFLGVTVVIFNLLLIPPMGIVGAALATLLAKVFFNLFKFLIILVKWKMQPFNVSVLKILAIGLVSFAVGWYLPGFSNYILDIIVRSTLTVAVYGLGILIIRPSVDVDYWLKKFMSKYF
ncbi:MAG: oligosaccharide flippase family protein [Bacteroidales bacterium]